MDASGKLEKRASGIHGFGIFAKTRMRKGKEFYKIPVDAIRDKPGKSPLTSRESSCRTVGCIEQTNMHAMFCWPSADRTIKTGTW